MKILILSLFIFVFTNTSSAITPEKFESIMQLLDGNNFDSTFTIMKSFESQDVKDPEYYVVLINYYFLKSKHETITVNHGVPQPDDTTLMFEDSLGNVVGYLGSQVDYNFDTLNYGIQIFEDGLKLFPDRLDMHFGLVYVCESVELYDKMTESLINIMTTMKERNNQWLWSFSKPLKEDAYEFILENVQSRVLAIINSDVPEKNKFIDNISRSMVEHFPQSTYGYTNLGYLYIELEKYSKSVEYLLEAYNLDSKDIIVIANLARAYSLNKEISEAKKYYNLMIKIGSIQDEQYAKKQLKLLE